ncbi:MAG: aldo/keto reductase [Actinobacteria bacterium]|nr:MAG: aldo/keto reductase [Actinomycetota bacterium]
MPLSLGSLVEIAPGVLMPRLGFGTYKAAEGSEVEGAVAEALRAGYRGVDTASFYGNERGVGRAIAESGLARKDVFVATKVWNDEQGYDGTLRALERSLGRLGLAHVDLYLVHWPQPALARDTWRAMERALADGLTRAIGVCNHLPHHVEALLAHASVPPAIDQVEFHPLLQSPDLQAYLRERGIALQAWAPLIRGRAGSVPELVRIAGAHGVTPSQVCVRWALQLGHCAVPKSVHAARIRENADVFGFELSEDEMAAIAALDRSERLGPHPDVGPGA